MHQSSHRILRWTEDDRPFSRDFKDLFSTLIVAVELKTHRVRLTKRPHTFTSAEAVDRLGSLRFTQSNKRPSPEDPNVHVTTKISTTFSMVPAMARFLCNKFVTARFIESCEGKDSFTTSDSVWQLTPKGLCILQAFTQRNGVIKQSIYEVLESPRNKLQLMFLERDPETDQVVKDRATIEVISRRFAGMDAPSGSSNSRSSSSGSDSDSIDGVSMRTYGVKMIKSTRSIKASKNFTGRVAIDWLLNSCTVMDEKEALEVASCFFHYKFIKSAIDVPGSESRFNGSRSSLYYITEDGDNAAKWSPTRHALTSREAQKANGVPRDSNGSRMISILATPALRILFREFLRDTHCEENLQFYTEVKDFLTKWDGLVKRYPGGPPLDFIREVLAGAYDLYNSFLAPGSPCELNIDHTLRNSLVSRMTRFELPDNQLLATANDIVQLYDQAQTSVFKLMSADSVPKFLREPKYAEAIRSMTMDGRTNDIVAGVATIGITA